MFVSEFDVPGVVGIPTSPRETNLESETLNAIMPPPMPFGNFPGTAGTEPFSVMPDGPLREHGSRTLIKFPLDSLMMLASGVKKAAISLVPLEALSAFENPNAALPMPTDLRPGTEDREGKTVTCNNHPDVAADPTATGVQDSLGNRVGLDVTDPARLWLTDPASNSGLQRSQRDAVDFEVPGARDRDAGSLHASSAFEDPSLRPYLEVAPVPVPAAFGLLAMAVAGLGALRQRRRAA